MCVEALWRKFPIPTTDRLSCLCFRPTSNTGEGPGGRAGGGNAFRWNKHSWRRACAQMNLTQMNPQSSSPLSDVLINSRDEQRPSPTPPGSTRPIPLLHTEPSLRMCWRKRPLPLTCSKLSTLHMPQLTFNILGVRNQSLTKRALLAGSIRHTEDWWEYAALMGICRFDGIDLLAPWHSGPAGVKSTVEYSCNSN